MMRKSGGPLLLASFVLAILGILVYSLFVFLPIGEKMVAFGPPGSGPPPNCSVQAISDVWNYNMKVDSSNLYIATNTSRADVCENYYAWKQVDGTTYILSGSFVHNASKGGHTIYQNDSAIYLLWGNYSSDVNFSILNLTSAEIGRGMGHSFIAGLKSDVMSYAFNWSRDFTPDGIFNSKFDETNGTPFLTDLANKAYYFSYVLAPPAGTPDGNYTVTSYYSDDGWVHMYNQSVFLSIFDQKARYCDPNWTCSDWESCNGTAQSRTCSDLRNCGLNYLKPNLTQSCTSACVPNWVPINGTSCNSTESFVIWYNDTNKCANSTRANETGYCDYDKNGFIGRHTDIADVNLNIYKLTVDGSDVNYSKNYTGRKDVEFIEDVDDADIVRVWLRYNFDDAPLNLKTVRIEKQDDNDDYGYLIVKGLDISNKQFRIDNVNGRNSVCVKDASNIDDPSDIGEDCDGSNEYALACPGTESEFNCTDGGDGTYLVSGLDNSGVKELDFTVDHYVPPVTPVNPGCTPNWYCPAWPGQCTDGVESRTCSDLNGCPNATGTSYVESRPCEGDCVSRWDCSDWTPEDCNSNEKQTQHCVDLNECKEAEDRTRDCSSSGGGGLDWTLTAIIGGAAVIILGAVVLIIFVKRRKDAQESEEKNSPAQLFQRPPAGTFGTTHYGGPQSGFTYRR